VRLTPNGGKNEIERPVPTGAAQIKARVTAAPENGKANKALVKLLAKSLKLPPSTISIKRGAKDRAKTLAIEGDPKTLRRLMDQWSTQA
jgi:hypothetical protein